MAMERHRLPPSARMNILVAMCATEVVGIFLRVVGNADPLDLMIALPTFLFMVYIALALVNAQNARKSSDRRDIASLGAIARQCERMIELVDDVLKGAARGRAAVDYRTYLVLGQLATSVRLFVSRYERYLGREGVWAALEAETLATRASLSEPQDLGDYVASIRLCIYTIKKNVVGLDDPDLSAMREAP